MVYNAEGRSAAKTAKPVRRRGVSSFYNLTPFFLTDCNLMILVARFRRSKTLLLAAISMFSLVATSPADDWPQWRGPTRDGVWHESGLVESLPAPQIPIKWKAAVGAGYSGPSIAKGRVYVTDRITDPRQIERVHCFDEQTGKPLWSHQYDCQYSIGYPAGPRASVAIDDGRAYALGSMGNLHCLDAADGRVLWHHDLNSEYQIRMPIWGISASPLVDGDRVIVQIGGSNGACLVAFDKVNGKEKWRALKDDSSYAAPLIVEQAGRRVLVCMTGNNIAGLNPETGETLWLHPFPPTKMVIATATPVIDNNRLFVTSFYDGCMVLKLATDRLAVEQVWKRNGRSERETDGLQSIISTPIIKGSYIYGVDSYGELRCLHADTGERIWENLDATPKARWSTIHMVRNGEQMWMFNERGELLIGKLSPAGFEEISRSKLIEPTRDQLNQRGGVCWAHPAYANKCVFARNDVELVCASLAK